MNRESKSPSGLIIGIILLIVLLIIVVGLSILVDSFITLLLLYPFLFIIVKRNLKNFGIILLIPLILNTIFFLDKRYNIIESIDYEPYFVNNLYENLLTKYSSDDLYSDSDNKQLLVKTYKLTSGLGFFYTPKDEREMKLKNKQEIIEDILRNKYMFMFFVFFLGVFDFLSDKLDNMMNNERLFKKIFNRLSILTWIWFIYTFYYFSDRLFSHLI